MVFDRMKQFLKDTGEDASRLFGRIKDKDTFRRVVQASYLIANADGTVTQDERSALARLIHKELPQFALSDILTQLDTAADTIAFDATIGQMEVLADIAKARGDARDLIMRTAVYIGGADGDFDANERSVAREICTRMDLKPNSYGL